MKVLRATPLLALVCACVAAPAPPLAATQGWLQLKSQGFTLISQLNEADTAAWATRLSQFLTAMKSNIHEDPRLLGPFTLVIFSNHADFWNSSPLLKSGNPLENLGAFSRSGSWGAITGLCEQGSNQDTQRLLFQTAAEWLLSADPRHRPKALGMGLAEVYSAFIIDNHQEVTGRRLPGWTARLRHGATDPLDFDGRFLKIEDLLAVKDFDSIAPRHGEQMFWKESWGFAHFLMFSKEMAAQHAMDRLLDAFTHTSKPHDALQLAFGAEAATIDTRFYDYLKGSDFFEVRLPLEPPPPIGPPVAASPAAVAAILAELEASVRRPENARAYAAEAIRLAPNEAPSHEAMALADFSGERHPEAAAECREAIRLNTTNGWTWFEAAQEIGRPAAADAAPRVPLTADQAREAMNDCERAIICTKGLGGAYRRLADLLPLANEVTPDDGKFIVFGRTLFPDDGWIEIGHAQWARRMHHETLARQILDDVIARAASLTPEEIAAARTLRQQWGGASG